MNETMQSILARRSFKAFDGRPIDADILNAILEAGKYAPSGMNRQPWHFSVIQSAEARAALGDGIRAAISRLPAGFQFPPVPAGIRSLPEEELRGAPLAILVSGDDSVGTVAADCALAMENMFIAAASFGVMSGWSHMIVKDVCKDAALSRRLGVPEGYSVYAAAFFGYPLGPARDRGTRRADTVSIL